MGRYIDAEKIELAWYVPDAGYLSDYQKRHNDMATYAQGVIDNAPSEDVAPVIHAHWVTNDYGYAILNEKGHTLYLAGVPCSRCHMTGQTNWNYCPNCGAKMDEVVQ